MNLNFNDLRDPLMDPLPASLDKLCTLEDLWLAGNPAVSGFEVWGWVVRMSGLVRGCGVRGNRMCG